MKETVVRERVSLERLSHNSVMLGLPNQGQKVPCHRQNADASLNENCLCASLVLSVNGSGQKSRFLCLMFILKLLLSSMLYNVLLSCRFFF